MSAHTQFVQRILNHTPSGPLICQHRDGSAAIDSRKFGRVAGSENADGCQRCLKHRACLRWLMRRPRQRASTIPGCPARHTASNQAACHAQPHRLNPAEHSSARTGEPQHGMCVPSAKTLGQPHPRAPIDRHRISETARFLCTRAIFTATSDLRQCFIFVARFALDLSAGRGPRRFLGPSGST